MYWGETENVFDSLVAFTAGFDLERSLDQPRLIPRDFHEFVWQRIGSGPMNGHGWTSAIRMAATSAREAFDLFFALREEYEATRPA